MESRAPAGKVTTQDIKIVRITLRLSAAIPRATPTPKTAPTKVCVVEIGKPVRDASTTVVAAANVAAKPLLGVNLVMHKLRCVALVKLNAAHKVRTKTLNVLFSFFKNTWLINYNFANITT